MNRMILPANPSRQIFSWCVGVYASLVFAMAGVLRADTVALWLFDDPPGSPVAVDSSGHGYDLTIGPGAAIVSAGKFGGALDADASPGDKLGAFRYHAEKALNPGDKDWTLEVWIKAKPELKDDNRLWGLSGVNYIDFGRTKQTVRPAEGVFMASRFLPVDGVLGWNKPTGNLKADAEFHHVSFVYDAKAKEVRHYFDGKLHFTASGPWKDVPLPDAETRDAVFPPHYPMLQIGMRDAMQQWTHRQLGGRREGIKKFQGLIDEMRFSDVAIYAQDFLPPGSFAGEARLVVRPERVELAAVENTAPMIESRLLVETGPSSGQIDVVSGAAWLTVEAPQARGTQFVALRAAASRLKPGRHETTLTVSLGAEKHTVQVGVAIRKAEEIRDVGDRRQLIFDRRFIAESRGVELRINPPEKFAVEFDRTKSRSSGGFFPKNVFWDEGLQCFRMYYMASGHIWCMSSDDGVRWEHVKTNDGRVLLKGVAGEAKLTPKGTEPRYAATQAPPLGGSPSGSVKPLGTMLIYDPHDVPERRYKYFQEISFMRAEGDGTGKPPSDPRKLTGVYGYYSADGMTFTATGVRVLPVLSEVLNNAFWDKSVSSYIIYLRCMNIKDKFAVLQGNQFIYRPGFEYKQPEGKVGIVEPENAQESGFENVRAIARLQADDLLKPWTTGVSKTAEADTLYATANDLALTLAADERDGFLDFYTGYPVKYPGAQDTYVMLLQSFRHFHPSRQPWFPRFEDANGPLQGVLAMSRDGVHWDRMDRTEYIPLGLRDEWDRGRTVPCLGMIRVGDYLYQYYSGGPLLHDSVPLRDEDAAIKPEWKKIGIAGLKQRLDGFVSADAGHRGGTLTTPPIRFTGRRLVINQNSGGLGMIFVELRDLAGQPIPGYTLGDCEEVSCNDVNWEVRWRGSADVSKLAGQPVQIHFRMTNAKLYSFDFEE